LQVTMIMIMAAALTLWDNVVAVIISWWCIPLISHLFYHLITRKGIKIRGMVVWIINIHHRLTLFLLKLSIEILITKKLITKSIRFWG
jgi:hypothetical protein